MNNYIIAIIIIVVMIVVLLLSFIPGYVSTETVPKIHYPVKSVNHTVPQIIHRTWYSNTMSRVMYETAYKPWIKLNPSYTMIWYNDQDVEKIMKNYGKREYRAFKKVICGAYKMDLFRLLILYEYGGVYVDSYSVPNVSVDEMISRSGLGDEKDIFISILDCEYVVKDAIHNGFILASPKHPFIKQAIKDVLNNIEYGKEDIVMSMTGPLALSKAIHKCLNHNIPHQIGLNEHAYKYYLFAFHFGFYQHVSDKNKIMFRKKMDILYCFMYQKAYKYLSKDKTNYNYANSIGKVCYTDEELFKLYQL